MNGKIFFLNYCVKQHVRHQVRLLNSNYAEKVYRDSPRHQDSKNSLIHCFKTICPWKNKTEFFKCMISSIIYNEDGLIAINKPFGVKVRSTDESVENPHSTQYTANPSIQCCDYALEDALPEIQNNLNLSNLLISKSCERYSSGIVLLSDSEKNVAAVVKSIRIAKHQRRNHLTHWFITLGYSVTPYRTERVGVKFLKSEGSKTKQPVIMDEPSKRSCKRRIVLASRVEYRVISVNTKLETSLVEISTSSDQRHFVRVYASERIATILGDPVYCSRMNTFLGLPVKVRLQNFTAFNMQPLAPAMSERLNLPKGVKGHSMVPMMLHMRSILLPSFKGKDVLITAEPSSHFQWTAEKLELPI